jgi:pyruvate/2-oxoglutarate dehydrogenase complex dihydrolipoamide acyltransferase (E2) component
MCYRVVDGAVGGEFLKALKNFVENPLALLL